MTNSQKTPMLTEQQQADLLQSVFDESTEDELVAWGKEPELYEIQDEEDLARICVMLFEMDIHSLYRIRLFADPAAETSVEMTRQSRVRFRCDSSNGTFYYTDSKTLFTALLEWWHSVRAFGSVQVYKSGDGR